MAKGFCHLNLHTDRSQYVGMIKPAELVDWCKRTGLTAAAITDHDNMCAAVELYKSCKKHHIKPIYGMEVSISDDKTQRIRGVKNLVLIAKSLTGFKNLVTLATLGSMYFYYRPRIELADLMKYGEGIEALTACMHGLTASAFLQYGVDGLWSEYQKLQEIFQRNLFLEIQPTLKDVQRSYNEACRQIAETHRVPLIVTGDPHYFREEDREFHEHFMRIKMIGGKESGWTYPFVGPYHVRTYDEMVEQFATLHGYDITMVPVFKAAFDNVDSVVESTSRFDIKEGVKIPTYFI